MKIDLLKKIIKETVKEALQEELKEILNEFKITKQNSPVKISHIDKKEYTSSNPLSEMINITKDSMGSEDYRNILNFNSSNAPMFKPGDNVNDTVVSSIPSGPQPGLDISKLDFVKNASKVYNASLEKDRQKNGL